MRIRAAIILLIAATICLLSARGAYTMEELMNEGKARFDELNYPEAKLKFEQATSLNPSSPEAWDGLGLALSGMALMGDVVENEENYSEAIKCFEKAIRLNPNYSEAYRDMAWAYSGQENNEKALELINKAIEMNSSLPDAHNVKGHIFLAMHRYEDAIDCFDYELKIDPNNTNAKENKLDAEVAKGV